MDISEGLASDEAKQHPLKTFVDISNGQLAAGDKIIITSPELLDLISNSKDTSQNSIVEKIISMSCKKAVKAGDKLSQEEISILISNIKNEDIPLTCPHGRPFVMKLDKKQIDKKVGRIN